MAGRKVVNQSKVTVVGFGKCLIMWNTCYLQLKCVNHKNQPVWSFISVYPCVKMQPLHEILSPFFLFRWTQWLQTFCCGRVGRGNSIWRPLNWAPSPREVSTWLFRPRAPAWLCCPSGCSSRSVQPWSALCPRFQRPSLVRWCKRRRVCVLSTPPSMGPGHGHLSSSVGRMASGWASPQPPAPAYLDLSLLKDKKDAEVRRRRTPVHTHVYIQQIHRGNMAGRLNKNTMERVHCALLRK